MSYIKIWIHCVWTTKNRIPYLTDTVRESVILHIRDNARQKGIYLDEVNGYHNHLHAIISLGGTQSSADVMQKIKGESSYWINRNKLTRFRFEWQDDYYAVSVDTDHLKNLRKYIRNQVQHHQIISLDEELKSIEDDHKPETNL